MLFNINTLSWDDEILSELDIPKSMLPQPKPSSCIYGKTDPAFFGGEIPTRELPAISRPPFSVRLVFRPEKPKTLTERAAFY